MSRVVMVVMLLLLGACATFESGTFPMLERWPAEEGVRREVAVQIEGVPEKFRKGWQVGAERVVADWRRGAGAGSAELEGRTLVLWFEHPRQDLWTTRIWMGVCAMTAGIVPARTEQCFDLRAVVLDASQAPIGVVKRTVSATTWVGWLPLFALPFAGGGLGGLVQDTTRSVLLEAVDQGYL